MKTDKSLTKNPPAGTDHAAKLAQLMDALRQFYGKAYVSKEDARAALLAIRGQQDHQLHKALVAALGASK